MAGHQPNFLPYLGFFDKMVNCDVFVIRDEVQFVERDWHHRNKIRIDGKDENGNLQGKWLTVPVEKEPKYLKDIVIKNDVKQKNVPWNVFMLREIKNRYDTTPFFRDYFPALESIFMQKKEKLIDFNMEIINFLKNCFNINTELVYASQLKGFEKTGEASLDLARLTKIVGAGIYLSGPGGVNYMNKDTFSQEGIDLRFQDFQHPVYPQRYHGFVPNLASIDALFNVGNIFNKKYTDKSDDKHNSIFIINQSEE